MTFAHPWLLLLLLLLPLAAWLKGKRGRPPAFLYSSVQLVRAVLNVSRSRAGAFLAALRWIALALFLVGLAQPRLIRSETPVRASGIDIAVALDMSGSMASEDFKDGEHQVNRLFVAKKVLRQFILNRPNDRIGLVAFATDAYIASPPTLDHDFLLDHLDRLNLCAIDPDRTAIGSALSAAINRLRDLKSKSKIVILMTDGQNNAGALTPLTVAEAARSLGIKVYTIGVGVRGTAPKPRMDRDCHPLLDFFGNKQYSMEPVDVDEETLKKIADLTGGNYYRADNTEKFAAIYGEIDKLEKTEMVSKKFTDFEELFPWLLAPGFGVLLVEIVLRHTMLRRLP